MDNSAEKMQGNFGDMTVETKYPQEGLMSPPTDPLQLDIPDDELSQIIDDREEDYDTFYTEKYNLFERRKKLEVYYFGRQIMQEEKEKLFKAGESKYNDNVLYEIMGTIKPLGMSRVPDLMATPANDSESAVLMAQELSKALDTEIKEEENRFVLGLAYKHLPVYFTSCIKIWWNPEKDDYEFGVIHPDLIKFDYTSSTKNADIMQFVSQKVPLTVQEIMLRFPAKKEKFLERLKKDGLMPGEDPSWALLATVIKITEVWFHEYRAKEDKKVERVDGVAWKYKDVILHKMKNPNFDYEGEERYFAYDEPGNESTKRALNDTELMQLLMTGQMPQNVTKERVYHNYFRFPRKPYYFMGYDQWGKQPMDETSWMEQNLYNQENLDIIGKKIQETLKSRGHHILSKTAVTPADLEEIDFDERDLDLSVEGNPKEVYDYIPPEVVSSQEFQELNNIRDRMYAVAHSQAVRGEIKAEAPATNNQIAREGDFTAADDNVEDTINPAAQWMGEYAMQMIKLRYTKDHFRWVMGIAGDAVWLRLNRNMVADGMIVKIKSSGSDKLKAQNNAMEMAKMQMTDPFTFFTDMRLSDPEGRTEKLILAKTDPVAYLQKVVKGLDSSKALAKALMDAELPSPPAQPQQQPPANPVTMGGPAPAQPAPAQPQVPSPQATAQPAVTPPVQPPQQGGVL
jgi:hypothetical protein